MGSVTFKKRGSGGAFAFYGISIGKAWDAGISGSGGTILIHMKNLCGVSKILFIRFYVHIHNLNFIDIFYKLDILIKAILSTIFVYFSKFCVKVNLQMCIQFNKNITLHRSIFCVKIILIIQTSRILMF